MSSLQPTLVYLLYKCFARAFNSNETRGRTERITVTRYLELNSGLLRRQGGSGLALGQFKIPRAGYSHRTPTRFVTTTTAHLRSQILVFKKINFDTNTAIPHKGAKLHALPA